VLFGLEKFRVMQKKVSFFWGGTDNQAPSWLLAHPSSLGKIRGWVVRISAFKFRMQRVRVIQNIVADSLTRMFGSQYMRGSLM